MRVSTSMSIRIMCATCLRSECCFCCLIEAEFQCHPFLYFLNLNKNRPAKNRIKRKETTILFISYPNNLELLAECTRDNVFELSANVRNTGPLELFIA